MTVFQGLANTLWWTSWKRRTNNFTKRSIKAFYMKSLLISFQVEPVHLYLTATLEKHAKYQKTTKEMFISRSSILMETLLEIPLLFKYQQESSFSLIANMKSTVFVTNLIVLASCIFTNLYTPLPLSDSKKWNPTAKSKIDWPNLLQIKNIDLTQHISLSP